MVTRGVKTQCFIAGLFIFLLPGLINAAHRTNHIPLEFSLSVATQNTQFNFSANTYKTKFSQYGIAWYEHFYEYFHAGLEVGNFEMSQTENPLASARFTSGEYAGLLLRFLPIDGPLFTLMLNLNYRYNRSQGNSTNQESRFVWGETLFSGELQFKPTPHFDLFLATEYQILDGEQQDSGTISNISHFNSAKREGFRFGINFRPNRSGIISVEWLTGFRDGIRVYFKRKF